MMSAKNNIFNDLFYGFCAMPVGIPIMTLWLWHRGESFGTEHIAQALAVGFVFGIAVWPAITALMLFIRKGKLFRRSGMVDLEDMENFPLQAGNELSLQQRIVYAVSSIYFWIMAYMIICIFREAPYDFTSASLSALVGLVLGVLFPKFMRGLYIFFSYRGERVDPDYYSSEHDEMKEMYIILAVMTLLLLLFLTHE